MGEKAASPTGAVASFHLVRERGLRLPLTLSRLGTDRLRLPGVPGLAFWRLLGTGRGASTAPGADLTRSALFCVWEDESDLVRFLEHGPFAARWARADEVWHVRLRGRGGHGTWAGFDVPGHLAPGRGGGAAAIVTRAGVRRGAWPEFRRASREVDRELRSAAGLIDVVAIGEAPVGMQATFSLWESLDDAHAFAYRRRRHARVIRQTRDGEWYGEEMFARFEPYGSSGAWNGRDPLAAPG